MVTLPAALAASITQSHALTLGAAAVALVGLVLWWYFLARLRLVQDLPTATARGVALGLNELVGTATTSGLVTSPQAGMPCVYWKNVFYVDNGDNGWKKTGERQGGPVAFQLVDETRAIDVRPRKAQIAGEETYDGEPLEPMHGSDPDPSLVSRYLASRSVKRRRVVETVIPVEAPLYVLGTARLPSDSLDVHIGADPDARDPFLIRVGTEADVVTTERFGAWLSALVAVVAAMGGAVAWFDGPSLQMGAIGWFQVDPVVPLVFGAVVLAVMVPLATVAAYNGLRRLHQRVLAAWSLIGVELRRRHDLLPALAATAAAHGAHEQEVQTAIARLRSDLHLDDAPSDDKVGDADRELTRVHAAVASLVALSEAYPELGADALFASLQAELVDTEDRIALARSFYNTSVESLRSRAAAFPGVLIAWFFELDLSAGFTSPTVAPARAGVREPV